MNGLIPAASLPDPHHCPGTPGLRERKREKVCRKAPCFAHGSNERTGRPEDRHPQ